MNMDSSRNNRKRRRFGILPSRRQYARNHGSVDNGERGWARGLNSAVLVEFNDPIISSIGHLNVLVSRDHQSIGITNASPLLNEIAIAIENLYALVLAIADVHASLTVYGYRARVLAVVVG